MAPSDDQRLFLGTLFALASFVVYSEVAPFKVPFNNTIAKVAQLAILLTYGSGAAIISGASHGTNSALFGCLLLALNLLLIALAGSLAWQSYRRSKVKWAPLSSGMEHHFFLSHYQLNSGDQCDALE